MLSSIFFLLVISASSANSMPKESDLIHHDLTVVLLPNLNELRVEDSISLADEHAGQVRFRLHGGLSPASSTAGVIVNVDHNNDDGIPVDTVRIKLPAGMKKFVLKYAGKINHPLDDQDKEQARGFRETAGMISDAGVFISKSSLWYPVFENKLNTFKLLVTLPAGWDAVSQGSRISHQKGKDSTNVIWESSEPQDDIYLVAALFTEYVKTIGRVTAMVFLRSPERGLAEKYLEATSRYIPMYERLIGPYPYEKFALVENFWETGYGMPSFTLLGPKIIRLPFIINSSYPHEILHNWWGNSVYPDYTSGNWSEGLTAYLSDHLIMEQQGKGVEYRLTALQKYADYVIKGRDFPLFEFKSRHSSPSEAVGYGKSLMFFHMLRRELGDKAFIAGLRNFYEENRFRFAAFDDIQKSFETASGKDLRVQFDQIINKAGAPAIRLRDVGTTADKDGYLLTALIEQVQPDGVYHLQVPVAVTLEGKSAAYQTVLAMHDKVIQLKLHLDARPLRLDVDPEFDIFRRLDRNETPPAISGALGAEKMLILLPSSVAQERLKAYRELAEIISKSGPDAVDIRLDNEVEEIPSDRAVTILGWENRFLEDIKQALSGYEVVIDNGPIRLENKDIPQEGHSIVLTGRNPGNNDMGLLFIATEVSEALPGLGRKLPHYHKYSYIVFKGEEPQIMEKGRWPATDSPLTAFIPLENGTIKKVNMGQVSHQEPLITGDSIFSAEKMMETVRFLTRDELKGRGFGSEGLDKSAEYIARKFQEAGLKPAGDTEGSYIQKWDDLGGDPEVGVTLKNIVGVIQGVKKEYAGQSIVIGAHYDHLGLGWPNTGKDNRGKVHPGADDNASGVGVLVELARALNHGPAPDRSIVFVAFSGEEAERKGSRYYVTNEKQYPVNKCIGMINLDTVGRLGNGKLLVIGTSSAREWVHIFRGAGFVTGVITEAVPEKLDSSDQTSFEEAGVPAVQLFTGAHLDYHRPTDTVDKIVPEGLIKIASVAKEAVEYLAGRNEALTSTIRAEGKITDASKKERKVSLGTIPDFSYEGVGCRISGVVPESPAGRCGLKEGDIIIRINNTPVGNLKDLSDILKAMTPGEKISVTFLRDGKEMAVETEVLER